MAWPAPRRPAPGGGLAVLVVVTVLAALAAPHAKAVRGLVAGGLPTITVPTPPRSPAGHPAASGAELHQRRWLPTRRRLPLPSPGPPGPHACWSPRPAATGFGCRACAAAIPGTSRAPAGSPTTAVWRAVDVDQVDGRPVSPSNTAARRLAVWIGQGRAGVQPSEVGSPWRFGGRPWFSDAGHQGHLHVGFPGPTRPGGGR